MTRSTVILSLAVLFAATGLAQQIEVTRNGTRPTILGPASAYTGRAVADVLFAANTPKGGGSLQARTTNMAAGYLRPNGVPYSEKATVREFFNTFTSPEAGTWLIATTVVSDPEYLTTDLILSTQFKKETGRSRWNPRACDIAPPLVVRAANEEQR